MENNNFTQRKFKLIPPITALFILLSVLFFIFDLLNKYWLNLDYLKYLALHSYLSESFMIYQLVTYIFVPINIGEFIISTITLGVFGSIIENAWDSKKAFLLFIVFILGSGIIYLLVNNWFLENLHNELQNYNLAPKLDNFISILKNNYPEYLKENQLSTFISQWSSNPYDFQYEYQSSGYLNQLLKIKTDVPVIGNLWFLLGLITTMAFAIPNYVPSSKNLKYFSFFIVAFGIFSQFEGGKDIQMICTTIGSVLFGILAFICIKLLTKRNNKNTLYSFLINKENTIECIHNGWNWYAFFFQWLWAWFSFLYFYGTIVFLLNMLLVFISKTEHSLGYSTFLIIFQLGTAILFGKLGNKWRKEKLLRDGYEEVSIIAAKSSSEATEIFNSETLSKKEIDIFTEEIEEYNKILEMNPNNYEPYFNRGNIFYKSGQVTKAIKDFSTALSIKPDIKEIYL